jgi:hypothetical protein
MGGAAVPPGMMATQQHGTYRLEQVPMLLLIAIV